VEFQCLVDSPKFEKKSPDEKLVLSFHGGDVSGRGLLGCDAM
jgi:hypothetical protein